MHKRTEASGLRLIKIGGFVALGAGLVRMFATPAAQGLAESLYVTAGQALDWVVGWPRMPLPLGLATLIAARIRLRQRNLYDTSQAPSVGAPALEGDAPGHLQRSPDGSYNDLDQPAMGSAGTRFGRNVPLDRTYQEPPERIMSPNPRVISRELLARDTFKPATTLNLLAAAWLQFQVHDWLSHGTNQKEDPFKVELAPDDDWPERPMTVLRTQHDLTRPPGNDGFPPTYVNIVSHWWDASQLYGSDRQTQLSLRTGHGGKLVLGDDGLLPLDETGVDRTGINGNWWVGLSLMHNLFAREHNSICDRLAAEYPAWSDEELFGHARLINAALIAKIHTIDWTPAIIAHPTTRFALRGNWWGLEMERLSRLVGRLSPSEVISGIPGSPTDHHGVPYSITEEFVAVYRMHPLLPDEINFRSAANDAALRPGVPFSELIFTHVRPLLSQVGFANALYSLGTSHPGAITLHNYPNGLRPLVDMDGIYNDMATIDILRIRERGVPRYNDFRELLHKPRVRSFEELTDNPEWAEQLRRVYNGDVDAVDLMVGLYAEPLPPGFGFSDTAFRIFILMASRRLESDRFFTRDFRPQVYTQTGLNWIADNTMATVLARQCPELAPWLAQVDNAFAPWPLARA